MVRKKTSANSSRNTTSVKKSIGRKNIGSTRSKRENITPHFSIDQSSSIGNSIESPLFELKLVK